MKLGMTFEGGASRTVFSCGVADAFLEEGIMPDYFIGVSAGIAYGISYLSGQKGRNLTLAREYMPKKEYQGARYLFDRRKKTYYNLEYVFGEVPNKELPFDYEAFAAYPGEVTAVVTNIHTGRAEYLKVPRDDKSFEVLVASCALPVLFPPVKIGGRYYLDGGLSDSIPYRQAIKAGCDRNIVVLTRERGYVKKPEPADKVTSLLYRKYPNVVKAMKERPLRYNMCMREILELEKKGEIFVIAPDESLGVRRTEKNPERLTRLYELGYRKAKDKMRELRQYLNA